MAHATMKPERVLLQEKSAYARVEPPCPYFGTCGGCALQDLSYADQLTLKRMRLERALAAVSDGQSVEVVGLDDPWRYRNKAEFTFGGSVGQLMLGYHAARSFWRIVDLDDCLLLPEPAMAVVRDARALASQTGLPAYHPKTHEGFFRYLLIRVSRATGRMLLSLITTPGDRRAMEEIAQTLGARHPAIASVYWGVTSRLADIATPETLTLLRGEPFLEDQIGPFRLCLHPLSFLQPSHVQADLMYQFLADTIGADTTGVAWDLYCGIGVIALYLSPRFRTVYGIDVEPHHLELAGRNAALNNVHNVEFRAGRVESLLRDRRFWAQEAKPDVAVVDPPRAGLHRDAVSSLLAARPRRIGYVSCNVQSLAQDLAALRSNFPRYRLSALRAFDMFPQTNHVETVAVLDRV